MRYNVCIQQPRTQEVRINVQGVADKYEAAECGVLGLEPDQRLVLQGLLLVVYVVLPVGEDTALFEALDGITQDRRPQQLLSSQALWGQDCRQPLLGHTLVIQNVPAFTNPLTRRW